jgi:cellulose synthase operon protein C
MVRFCPVPFTAPRVALFLFLAIQVVGCGSQEDRARSHYERGMKFLSEHENAKAAIELRNAVKLKRDLIAGWKALAEIDEISSDWTAVVTNLRTIVELAPDDVSARLKLGKLLLVAGAANEAFSLASAGLDRDDRNADLHSLRAATALTLDNRASAVREAQTALGLDPTNADALMVLAVDRLIGGDAKGALSLLDEAAAPIATKIENNVGLQLLKLKLFGERGDLNSVEVTLKKLIDQNPRDLGYRKLLAQFYVEQHRIEDAEAELRRLGASNPSDSAAALDLVRFLFGIKGTPAKARQELNDRINAGGDVFPFQMALADIDIAEGNLIAGKQLLEIVIGNADTSERVQTARIALARMYLRGNRFEPAKKLADDVLREDPRNVSALTIRATIYLQRSKVDAAVADLVSALNYQPRAVDVMLFLATAYERGGLIELADKQLADATRSSNFDARVGLEYAEFLQRRDWLARAEDVLVGLIKRSPENIQVLTSLAQLRLVRQNWSGAQELAESIRRTGNNDTADQILGAILVGQGRYDEAITVLQRAYQVAPNAAQPMNVLTAAFLKADKREQALTFLNSVLAKDPANANALVLLGSIHFASGATDRAIESFSSAVKAQPNDSMGYQALSDVYLRRKNYDEAIRILETGMQKGAEVSALQMSLAHALEQKGESEAAISQYESMLKKQPGNLIVANNLASLLLEHPAEPSRLKRAQSIAAMLRRSQIPQFKDTLGWASYQQGDFDTAVSLCEEAAAALPDQAAVRYHLGMAYAAINRPEKASEQFKRALGLGANDRLAEEIRAALQRIGEL